MLMLLCYSCKICWCCFDYSLITVLCTMLAPLCLCTYVTLVKFVGVVFIILLSLFRRLCFVDCVGAVTCLCYYMILLFNLLAPFWLHTFVNSAAQRIFVPYVCTYHLSTILEWASAHWSPCKVNGVWTGKKKSLYSCPASPPPHPLVGYILTIQMQLSIYKSPSALPSYLYT